MKVSELLVRSLESYGVERAYGLVGTSILELMDALRVGRIRYVSTRHEQVAVSMADAEGRVTGRPGIAFVHGGPGFLNSLISVSNAYKDSSPLMLVAGAVKRRVAGMDSMLEVPQLAIVGRIVKKAWRIEGGQEVARTISEAYSLAASDPKGPVFLEVPEDVWGQDAGNEVVAATLSRGAEPHEADVETAARAITNAQRPLLVVGGGMNSARGADALRSILSKIEVPIVTTGNGRGAIPEDHPMSLGRIGFGGGSVPADRALGAADVVLCLGCGLSDISTYGYNLTPKGEVIVVDLDPLWEAKPILCSMHAACDAPTFTERLAQTTKSLRTKEDWKNSILKEVKTWETILGEALSRSKPRFVNAAKFLKVLGETLPRDAILAAGTGLHILYAYAFMKVKKNNSFLAATNMGSMGFVLPAALGAKLAFPKREVVAVMGDGEFVMTMHDLETAVREKVGAKLIIVNDNSYRVLLMRQKVQKMGRVFGTLHSNPNIPGIAEAFGAEALVVESNDEISEAVKFATKESEVPLIVELKVDQEDLPPLNLQASLMF